MFDLNQLHNDLCPSVVHRRRFCLACPGAGTAATKAANRAEDVGAVGKPAAGAGSGAAAGASYNTSHAQPHAARLHGAGHRAPGASAMREDAAGEAYADADDMGSDADVDADADADADADTEQEADSLGRIRMPDGDKWARANFLASLHHRHGATNDESDADEKLDVEDDEPDTCSGLLCFADLPQDDHDSRVYWAA